MAEAAEGAQTLKMPDKQLSSEEMQRNKAPLRYVKDWLIFREQSQRRVAEAVGVSEATVSKWLKGSQAVTVAQFSAIAKFLDADPTELMSSPPDRKKAAIYRMVGQVAQDLPSDALEEWLAIGRRLGRPLSKAG